MKKGFTIIELLAVVIIMSLLILIILPNILNSVSNKREDVSDSAKKMIYDATDIYIKENSEIYPNTSESTYCIKLETLVNSGKLVEPIKDLKNDKEVPLSYYVKSSVNEYNQFDYELVEECEQTP
ncbi:MAG: prepilin-type N-terminal cleavage/methylation domain-containing protein [Lactobacillales bacterium]|nr:prepilin-type N-terminal cleavage/methylation domain-containing protein [Lactobacillales bacterium]